MPLNIILHIDPFAHYTVHYTYHCGEKRAIRKKGSFTDHAAFVRFHPTHSHTTAPHDDALYLVSQYRR